MNLNVDFLTIPSISLLKKDDMEKVAFIESVSNTPSWTTDMFSSELDKDNGFIYGINYNASLVGFILINTILDEIHILKFGILPAFRHMGLGKKLLSSILDKYRDETEKYVWLEVRKSNNIAIGLYMSQGFEIKGLRKKYYADNDEDAYVMALKLVKLKNK